MNYALCPHCTFGHIKFPSDYEKMINKTYFCPKKECNKEVFIKVVHKAWKEKSLK